MLASLYFKNNHEIYACFYRNQKLSFIKGCCIPSTLSLQDLKFRLKDLIPLEVTHIITNECNSDFTPLQKIDRMKIMNMIKTFKHGVNITKYNFDDILSAYRHDDNVLYNTDYDYAKLLAQYHFNKTA